MAEPVMKLYTESTDGSYMETKESALVWHHQDADPGFGSAQAKEMLDHLESVLANEPVSVKSGQFIVEVKPQVHIRFLIFAHFHVLESTIRTTLLQLHLLRFNMIGFDTFKSAIYIFVGSK